MSLDRISIATARWLTNTNGLDGVVIIAFGEQVKSVSYGADVKKCRQLGKLIDAICSDLIDSGAVCLTEFEH